MVKKQKSERSEAEDIGTVVAFQSGLLSGPGCHSDRALVSLT